MKTEDLTRLTAVEAAAQIRAGALSSEDFVAAALGRIAAREPLIEAWAHLNAEAALADARAADSRQRRGDSLGPLHGIPVGIKDIIDTSTLPTECGTAAMKGRCPAEDARVVTKLRAAGAVILGKTVTTELAFYGPGKTRNPVNPAHTPGGSSSGSAAAVADFHVPLAVGTQTAGSIVRPASYCGVIGMKPTYGVVPRDGVLEQSAPLDTVGGFARSTADMALLLKVMAEPELEPISAVARRPLRLAFVRSPAWKFAEPATQEALLALVRRHADIVRDAILPAGFDGTEGLQRAMQFRDIARNYGPLLDANKSLMSAMLSEVVVEGRLVADDEYTDAFTRRDQLYTALAPLFGEFDAILTPAATGPAPAGLSSTGSPVFNFLWTYLGVPALSLPLLTIGGLPVGVQLVGARGADFGLLATAAEFASHIERAGV